MVFLVFVLFFVVLDVNAEECVSIPKMGREQKTVYVDIEGAYCLKKDIIRKPLFDIHSGEFKSFGGDSIVFISKKQGSRQAGLGVIDINLSSFSIEAHPKNMFGIRADGFVRNITLHDGTIKVTGAQRKAVSLLFAGIQNDDERIISPLAPGLEDVPNPRVQELGESNYRLERLNIYSGGRGVEMGGGKNKILNSHIEVDGVNAIFMYGPDSVIEGNTIIVHNGSQKGFDAAIKLRDAHGAVIRNNRIIYKGPLGPLGGKSDTAINLFDSTNVLIENNTVEGFDNAVRLVGKTSLR